MHCPISALSAGEIHMKIMCDLPQYYQKYRKQECQWEYVCVHGVYGIYYLKWLSHFWRTHNFVVFYLMLIWLLCMENGAFVCVCALCAWVNEYIRHKGRCNKIDGSQQLNNSTYKVQTSNTRRNTHLNGKVPSQCVAAACTRKPQL